MAILTGAGQQWTTSAKSRLKNTYDSQVRLADQLTRLYELPMPVIAAVNQGGVLVVGAGVALELMLTGRIIDADEAYRIKLANEVVAEEDLADAELRKAREIAANNAYGVWQTKTELTAALDASRLRHAKEIENRTQVLATFTNNPAQAAISRMEKRDPVWDEL